MARTQGSWELGGRRAAGGVCSASLKTTCAAVQHLPASAIVPEVAFQHACMGACLSGVHAGLKVAQAVGGGGAHELAPQEVGIPHLAAAEGRACGQPRAFGAAASSVPMRLPAPGQQRRQHLQSAHRAGGWLPHLHGKACGWPAGLVPESPARHPDAGQVELVGQHQGGVHCDGSSVPQPPLDIHLHDSGWERRMGRCRKREQRLLAIRSPGTSRRAATGRLVLASSKAGPNPWPQLCQPALSQPPVERPGSWRGRSSRPTAFCWRK